MPLLGPDITGRLRPLDLIARYVVEGFITGLHKSPYHGFSVEFSQHRPYMQGDELRHVDWRLFARSERFHIKQYEEETNLRAHILLDVSRSMDFSTTETSKFRFGVLLSACLSYLLVRQQDAVGLGVFSDKLHSLVPPRSTKRHLNLLLKELQNATPRGGTRTGETLAQIAGQHRRRGLVILISDLLDEEQDILRGLKHFRHMGHEVLVFHVLDPAERDFARMKGGAFQDLESGDQLASDPRLVAGDVNSRFKHFETTLRKGCQNEGIHFVPMSTEDDVSLALLHYLTSRKRMAG